MNPTGSRLLTSGGVPSLIYLLILFEKQALFIPWQAEVFSQSCNFSVRIHLFNACLLDCTGAPSWDHLVFSC